jgi:hypothetical protein
MTLLERLRYTLYLAAVAGALVVLAISVASADAVGWLPPAADAMVFNPFFPLVICLAAYLVAPWASRRFPIVRNRS